VAVDPSITYQNFDTGLGNVSIKAGTHKIQNTILNGNTSEFKETNDIELTAGRVWTMRKRSVRPKWSFWATTPPRSLS